MGKSTGQFGRSNIVTGAPSFEADYKTVNAFCNAFERYGRQITRAPLQYLSHKLPENFLDGSKYPHNCLLVIALTS